MVFNILLYLLYLSLPFFFIHHYFQNQQFENCRYAFKMSSDGQIHVRDEFVSFLRPPVAIRSV